MTHIIKNKNHILLISMPWQPPNTPSVQLGALKSYLEIQGYKTDTRHLHLEVVKYIDSDIYSSYHTLNALSYQETYHCLFSPGEPPLNKGNKTTETITEAVKKLADEIIERTPWDDYHFIGFTVTTVKQQLLFSVYLSHLIKLKRPGIPIVFGGYLCTDQLGVKLMEKFPQVDFVISGEGEESLAELAGAIINQPSRFPDIHGLGFRSNGRVIMNPGRESLVEIDQLPIPNYDEYFTLLQDLKRHSFKVPGNIRLPIEGSRGCWWDKCNFCSHNLALKTYRQKSPAVLVNEMEHLTLKYEVTDIFFVDNICSSDKELWEKIAESKTGYRFYRVTQRVDISKQLLCYMKIAGVKEVGIGVESFSAVLLEKMDKGINLISIIQVLKYCEEFTIIPLYNIMFGLPYETETDMKETAENIDYLVGYCPPKDVEFELRYGSPIYSAPGVIRNEKRASGYDYTALKTRLRRWRIDYFLDKPLFYYTVNDNENSLLIADYRISRTPRQFEVRGAAKELYLYCDEAKPYNDIYAALLKIIDRNSLDDLLQKFLEEKLMFKEKDMWLSLAPYKEVIPKKRRNFPLKQKTTIG